MEKLLKEIEEIIGQENVLLDEPMKEHTTFRVGGPADYYLIPKNLEDLVKTVNLLRENNKDYFILGNGSNLLVTDKGYRGIIIDVSKINNITYDGDNIITAETGASLKNIAKLALENSLAGYEFASGIPGTIGGATRMNAGAYGGEHSQVIESVCFLDSDGNIKEVKNEECDFGYRKSIFLDPKKVILLSKIKLKEGNASEIDKLMKELSLKRRTKQPLEYPSAGSTFKRPEGYFTGKLIQDSGLKGKELGGAAVSEKHAGFVINKNNATATDVLDLIKLIQDTIKENYGVDLEREVIVIGE